MLTRSTSRQDTMPTTAYDAMVQRCPRACPRAPVELEAPDDDLLGQAIQPALNHIEYTPVAHSCAKETSQLGKGEQWCSRNARNLVTITFGPRMVATK